MAKGHRSQIKRERNEQKDTRPSAKLSYARMSVQKACYVLDVIRGKDVETALGILTYNPRYASSVIKKLLESAGLEELLLDRETSMDLHRRLHDLPEPYREVFSLRVFGELSYSQIAQIFEKSESWARVTYYRAKCRLKEESL